MDYNDYLKSRHWRQIKERMYQLYKACQACGTTKDLNVHHNKGYGNIGREKLSELRLLCKRCHYRAHRKHKGFLYLRPSDIFAYVGIWVSNAYGLSNNPKKKRREVKWSCRTI